MCGGTLRDAHAFVGARIRRLREGRGTSRRVLSGFSGLAERLIGAMEEGRGTVRFDDLLCLARALGVSVTAFFEEDASDENGASSRAPGR